MTEEPLQEPFFRAAGDQFLPLASCRGPWDAKSLHGRVIIGLLGHAIEARHGGPDYLPARLTVDMYRLPGFDPIEVTTRVVRDGFRIKVVEAEFVSGGVSMARASCQLLRRTENAPGEVWTPPVWDVPRPDEIPVLPDSRHPMGGMWSSRQITGGFGEPGPRRSWMAERRELVEGVALTPFQRVAVAADFVSPAAHIGSAGLGYINTDVTLYLHRLPVTQWIGFESINHQATDGVAIGECRLYDEAGSIGTTVCAALAQKRPPPMSGPPAEG